MMLATWVWEILSWLSLLVMALVAGILVWRKLHRVFPLFFAFLLTTEMVGILRLVIARSGSYTTYFYAYWISDLAFMICNFLAVYELLVMRLFPRFYKIRFYRYLFAAAASSIIFLGWLTAFASPNRARWFLVEARVISFILVAMLVFFVSLMMLMGRVWTKYDFGIAFGFAINNAAVLVASAVWVKSHFAPTKVDQLPLIAFDISCLIWLYCFWSRDKAFEKSPALPPLDPAMLHQARSWEGLLKDWLTPGKSKR